MGALTTSQSNINPQVNHIQETNQNLTSKINNELQNTIMDVIMSIKQASKNAQPATVPMSTNEQVNTSGTNTSDTKLTKMVQTLQEKIDKLSQPTQHSKDINPKTGKLWYQYCHTHRCCNHWGQNCPAKGPNYRDEATFRNWMDGGNLNCLPVIE